MTVWIVLLLTAVVLSPLVWLRPSRRQQGRMAIRMAARSQGSVSYTHLTLPTIYSV